MIDIAAVIRHQNCGYQNKGMAHTGHGQIRPINEGKGRKQETSQIPPQVAASYATIKPKKKKFKSFANKIL